MSDALITQLPKDVQICTFGSPMKIGLSMTLESADHARALKQTIDLAILPLFEIEEKHKRATALAAQVESAIQQIADGTATEVDPATAD